MPGGVAEAVELLAGGGARVLAGGHGSCPRCTPAPRGRRRRRSAPRGPRHDRERRTGRPGSAPTATYADLIDSALVRERLPLLHEIAHGITGGGPSAHRDRSAARSRLRGRSPTRPAVLVALGAVAHVAWRNGERPCPRAAARGPMRTGSSGSCSRRFEVPCRGPARLREDQARLEQLADRDSGRDRGGRRAVAARARRRRRDARCEVDVTSLVPRALRAVEGRAAPAAYRAAVAGPIAARAAAKAVGGCGAADVDPQRRGSQCEIDPRMLLVEALRDGSAPAGRRPGASPATSAHAPCASTGRSPRRAQAGGRRRRHQGPDAGRPGRRGWADPAPAQAFSDHHAFQCGYCLSGVLLPRRSSSSGPVRPTDEEIREAIGGNLCRCTARHDRRRRSLRFAKRPYNLAIRFMRVAVMIRASRSSALRAERWTPRWSRCRRNGGLLRLQPDEGFAGKAAPRRRAGRRPRGGLPRRRDGGADIVATDPQRVDSAVYPLGLGAGLSPAAADTIRRALNGLRRGRSHPHAGGRRSRRAGARRPRPRELRRPHAGVAARRTRARSAHRPAGRRGGPRGRADRGRRRRGRAADHQLRYAPYHQPPDRRKCG